MPAASAYTHDCLLLFLLGGLMLQQAGTRVPILDCRASYLYLAFGEINLITIALQNLKKNLSLSGRLSRSLHFSLSSRLSNMLPFKKKKKTVLQSHNL